MSMKEQINDLVERTFSKHQLKFVVNQAPVANQQGPVLFLECCQPDTRSCGFWLLIAPNMIAMSGDIGELSVTPGHGRGVGWFRTSIENPSYFASKISQDIKKYEWNQDESIKYMSEYAKSLKPYEDDRGVQDYKQALSIIEKLNDGVISCPYEFYKAWYDAELDDALHIEVIRRTVIFQLAGMTWAARELDRMGFEKPKVVSDG